MISFLVSTSQKCSTIYFSPSLQCLHPSLVCIIKGYLVCLSAAVITPGQNATWGRLQTIPDGSQDRASGNPDAGTDAETSGDVLLTSSWLAPVQGQLPFFLLRPGTAAGRGLYHPWWAWPSSIHWQSRENRAQTSIAVLRPEPLPKAQVIRICRDVADFERGNLEKF